MSCIIQWKYRFPSSACTVYFIFFPDINECLTNKGGCDDRCVNTPGTYLCECDSEGYILGSNKHSCDGKLAMTTDQWTLDIHR